MLVVTCVEIIKDANDKPLFYTLKDVNGNSATVTQIQLKKAIRAEKIRVNNLRISGNSIVEDMMADKIWHSEHAKTRTKKGKTSAKKRKTSAKKSKPIVENSKSMNYLAFIDNIGKCRENFEEIMGKISSNDTSEDNKTPVINETYDDIMKKIKSSITDENEKTKANETPVVKVDSSCDTENKSSANKTCSSKKWYYVADGKKTKESVQKPQEIELPKFKVFVPAVIDNASMGWALKENQAESRVQIKHAPKDMWIESEEALKDFIQLFKPKGEIWYCIEMLVDFEHKQKYYNIIDSAGNNRYIVHKILRNAILSHKIKVINLSLTASYSVMPSGTKALSVRTNERLLLYKKIEQIDKIENPDDVNDLMNEVLTIVSKNKMFNKYKAYSIPTACGVNCILIEIIDKYYILHIPNNVTKLNANDNNVFARYLSKLGGNIRVKVFGGYGLTDTRAMFMYCTFDELILSTLITDNVTSMHRMFENSHIKKLSLRGCNTSKVTDMSCMFAGASIGDLNIKNINTLNVKTMAFMFCNTTVKELNISTLSTKNVKNMQEMFEGCNTRVIKLSGSKFVITEQTNTDGIFDRCFAELSCDSSNIRKLYNFDD